MVDGDDMWKDLLHGIQCKAISCELCLDKFKKSSLRVKIGDEDDYKAISITLNGINRRLNRTEVGRVFYLSVPPSAYLKIVRYIHLHGRPHSEAWLRVVLEKPFGSDLASAQLLASDLEQYLVEDEVYRVDHYLGKWGVQQILPFRRANSANLQSLWNKMHVQQIEITLKERLDVKGRWRFFDKYGIIRDVHQNHLTEVLLRLLVDTREQSQTEFHRKKANILAKLFSPALQQSILGQYNSYQTHLLEDDRNSSTPTYATVLMYSREAKWNGVPIILTAGKKMDERKAFARIVFKQWVFSLVNTIPRSCPAEIVFLIQDEELGKPGILISQHFSGMDLRYGDWEWTQSWIVIRQCSYAFLSPHTETFSNAYFALMEDILNGRKESFVDTESLVASWEVWGPLVNEMESAKSDLILHQYSPEDLSTLDFRIEGSRLVSTATGFLNQSNNKSRLDSNSCSENATSQTASGFRYVVGDKHHTSSCLARELYRAAMISSQEGREYHFALPGGQSPRPFLTLLSLEYAHTFPWENIHIWQTDERCVKTNHTDSNWNQIDKLLLSHVCIPYHHLHPMPIELQNGLCSAEDEGDKLYVKQLVDNIGSATLDHVILGVGSDGHIASIFPSYNLSTQVNGSSWVHLVQLKHEASVAVKKRMTLSYEAISSAKAVSIVIMGAGKENVVNMVMNDSTKLNSEVPILQLLLQANGKKLVTFYIAS